MHLSKPLQFNKLVKPIELPQLDEEFTGNAVLSGWGVTINNPFALPSRNLQTVTLDLLSYDGNLI